MLQENLEEQRDLAPVLVRPGTVGRTHIERHLAGCDEEVDPSHARLWRRLFFRLGELATLSVQGFVDATIFFTPDGKYRKQIFAVEDQRDGVVSIYLPDVLAEALQRGILLPLPEAGDYGIPDHEWQHMRIEQLDASNTPLPPAYVKNMLGWNRKALRVTLVASDADGPRVAVAEAMCELALE